MMRLLCTEELSSVFKVTDSKIINSALINLDSDPINFYMLGGSSNEVNIN